MKKCSIVLPPYSRKLWKMLGTKSNSSTNLNSLATANQTETENEKLSGGTHLVSKPKWASNSSKTFPKRTPPQKNPEQKYGENVL